jgi:hypothetical protein
VGPLENQAVMKSNLIAAFLFAPKFAPRNLFAASQRVTSIAFSFTSFVDLAVNPISFL